MLQKEREPKVVPSEEEAKGVLEDTIYYISEIIARKYVQNKIETQVERSLQERQDKYMDEVKLSIIKKQKGPENEKTKKKIRKTKAFRFKEDK